MNNSTLTNMILDLLSDGKTFDDVASEVTNALNEAKKAKEESDKVAREVMIADADGMLEIINCFFDTYFPNLIKISFTGEEFVEAMEEMAPKLKELNALLNSISTPTLTPTPKTEPATAKVSSISDDPITYFLRTFNL